MAQEGGAYARDRNTSARLCGNNAIGAYAQGGRGGGIHGTLWYYVNVKHCSTLTDNKSEEDHVGQRGLFHNDRLFSAFFSCKDTAMYNISSDALVKPLAKQWFSAM